MSLVQIRRIAIQLDEIFHEGGEPRKVPHRRGAIAMVCKNPYAGRYVEDIMPLIEALNPHGLAMAKKLLAAMQARPDEIEAYGKGAIIGTAGEVEHGAVWHPAGGYAMREALGGTKAIVPSTKKVGVAGTRIDIPVHHVNAAYVRSHFDAIEVGVADGPRPDEAVFILAMTIGARVHARAGGLQTSEIKGDDGLR
ncbi:amino acid synthesis family protein [Oceanibacterium hippocampi]|uniref:Amino acid synthesis n=1 Tax=Oceanibacterium hippocampi TaxID=745714 RepID=A0A1Y5S066_9PROT|nr:amino acid synthesis family protein [Oceanibacterium hippocampi]SLN26951.1 hypothetical protein OCH7691_00867 [Oceanibacterium hippocampi]